MFRWGEKTFDFTVQEFENALRTEIDQRKGKSFLAMKDMEHKDEYYQIKLADGIYALIYTDKDNKVKEIRVVATTAAFLVQNKKVRIAYQSTLKAVDPSLSVIQELHIFEELGITGRGDMLVHSSAYSFNDVIYSYVGDIEKELLVLYAKPM
ncbi:MAG: hypothetical protein GX072_06265 [Lysinibacillus sp.]|nr:hypothetical protein [Lysinibacillus sp.]